MVQLHILQLEYFQVAAAVIEAAVTENGTEERRDDGDKAAAAPVSFSKLK